MRLEKLLLVASISAFGCSSDASTEPARARDDLVVSARPAPAAAIASTVNGKPLVLRLFGTGAARAKSADDPDAVPADATCFDIPLFDASTGRAAGTATDCLSDIVVVGTNSAGAPILRLTGTTVFDFGRGNVFVTQGLTTVQPTTHGSLPVTHITGAIPDPGSNGVIFGSGGFAGLVAEARLSGAVNLSLLDSDGLITFDCLFVIDPA